MFFDVNAKLDENKKGTNQVALGFNLLITTKPNIVKYTTSGTVILDGPPEEIKKKLEPNPKTKIPQILFTVYQLVFNSIYMLAGVLNTPYPPPDLLHPMSEKIKILPETEEQPAPAQPQTAATPAPPAENKETPKPA